MNYTFGAYVTKVLFRPIIIGGIIEFALHEKPNIVKWTIAFSVIILFFIHDKEMPWNKKN
jgi:hypothetical protein